MVSEFFIATSFWWWILIALWHSVTKRGSTYERCFWHSLYLIFVLGGDFIFDWFELVELFRLYLSASLCILLFSSCHFVGLFMLGGIYFLWFLFQTSYWFMIMSSSLLYVFIVCVWNQDFYFSLLVLFFPHMRLCILFKCFRKYTGWFIWAAVYSCNWWIVVRLNLCFWALFCKGLFTCKLWATYVVFCHGLPKGEFVRF